MAGDGRHGSMTPQSGAGTPMQRHACLLGTRARRGNAYRRGVAPAIVGGWGLGDKWSGAWHDLALRQQGLPAGLVAKIFAVVLIPSEWRAAIAHLGNFI